MLCYRFTAKELKALGQQVLRLLLMEKDIDLFFGQQTVFRPSLPDHFELVGTNKAFLTYDRRIFKVNIPDKIHTNQAPPLWTDTHL